MMLGTLAMLVISSFFLLPHTVSSSSLFPLLLAARFPAGITAARSLFNFGLV
jgi:hypothetical protein